MTVEGRRGQLALRLQEVFTAAARLRSGRDVTTDATAFRARIKQLLGMADREGRQLGYAGNDVRLAIYAFIAFLDESVLNSAQPAFADWPRMPLQEEIFGDHMGGRTFFENLRELLAQQDSEDVADVLEVYQLCLLLGFRGRYSAGGGGEIHALLSAVADKIQRVRRAPAHLSPNEGLPRAEQAVASKDLWLPRLQYLAAGLFGLAVLLFVIFKLTLGSAIGSLNNLVR
jgi:type VI secretion system protein ImpK